MPYAAHVHGHRNVLGTDSLVVLVSVFVSVAVSVSVSQVGGDVNATINGNRDTLLIMAARHGQPKVSH